MEALWLQMSCGFCDWLNFEAVEKGLTTQIHSGKKSKALAEQVLYFFGKMVGAKQTCFEILKPTDQEGYPLVI